MAVVKGSALHKAFGPAGERDEEREPLPCQKYLAPLARRNKKKAVDLEAIGSRANNQLLDLLRCRNRFHARSNSSGQGSCKAAESAYDACHSSVMGTGSFRGRRHCGRELGDYLECVVAAASAATEPSG